jgi:hypothetical protein
MHLRAWQLQRGLTLTACALTYSTSPRTLISDRPPPLASDSALSLVPPGPAAPMTPATATRQPARLETLVLRRVLLLARPAVPVPRCHRWRNWTSRQRRISDLAMASVSCMSAPPSATRTGELCGQPDDSATCLHLPQLQVVDLTGCNAVSRRAHQNAALTRLSAADRRRDRPDGVQRDVAARASSCCALCRSSTADGTTDGDPSRCCCE